MSFVQSVASRVIETLLQVLMTVLSRDRRALIIERRAKVLALAKEMKTAGISAAQLRRLEHHLTREE
jgi:hypothetical protein